MAKKLTLKKRIIIISVSLVLLLGAGATAYYFFVYNKSNEAPAAESDAPESDMSTSVGQLADGNSDETITRYDQLIADASTDEAKAQLYLERASLMRDYAGDTGLQQMLEDAQKAEELSPSMASAYMLYDAAQRLGDAENTAKYQELYQQRLNESATDPNEGGAEGATN